MTHKQRLLKDLVDRFLAWPLPKTVNADQCATDPTYRHARSGTNLLNATEAEEMFKYVLSGGDWHGCNTGDCPHEKQVECDQALAEAVSETTQTARCPKCVSVPCPDCQWAAQAPAATEAMALRIAIKQALDEIDAELYPDAQDTLWRAYESRPATSGGKDGSD